MDRAWNYQFLLDPGSKKYLGRVKSFDKEAGKLKQHFTDMDSWVKGQFKERDIFLKQLLLKIFCASRNDDALTGTDNGNEVSQSLAGAGPSLDNQMTLFFERLLYRLRHLQLSLPELVCRVSA